MNFSCSVRTPCATKPRWLISASAGRGGSPLERALQRAADDVRGQRRPHRLEQRRHHVDALHLALDARAAAAAARQLEHQRDADQLVEQAAAVEPAPVVEELLAVVGHEEDERVVVEAQRLQLAHEAAELAGRRRRRRRRTARLIRSRSSGSL
jgi:hypothetical protein